jgi:F-type H+-transporting ATPase subunit alpha
MFSRFGGLTDARVAGKIARGERIRALIAQPRFSALRTVDEIALLAALSEGVFDAAPAGIVAPVRTQLAARLQSQSVQSELAKARAGSPSAPFNADVQAALVAAVRELVEQLTPPATSGTSGTGSAR